MNSHRCRALLITAPASGQGKTTVTAALARHYRQQGKRVHIFKCGPDFIDPMILQQASGQPVYSLDLWMVGEALCRQQLFEAAKVADLILIEGVMGLFDGTPSSADLAELFDIPLLLVINSKGMAQTFGAVAHGLTHYRPELKFAAVLANRVASERHAEMLSESLPAALGSLAYMGKDEAFELPSRHLGLLQASEVADLDQRLNLAAAALHIPNLEQLAAEIHFEAAVSEPLPPLLEGVRIGIAKDEAFSFIYNANIDCLERMGAELHYFSPLHDNALPEVDSLWFPGGYPELHAEQLSANQKIKQAIMAHHQSGQAILAECGGMLYLSEAIVTHQQQHHRMVGLLSGSAIMQQRLGGLGMQSVPLPEGELRGHTFHYSHFETSFEAMSYATKQRNGQQGEAIYRQGRLLASYIHLYFPSSPAACAALFTPPVLKMKL